MGGSLEEAPVRDLEEKLFSLPVRNLLFEKLSHSFKSTGDNFEQFVLENLSQALSVDWRKGRFLGFLGV
jgi:hypothetical protein